jgi:hypothetical protein
MKTRGNKTYYVYSSEVQVKFGNKGDNIIYNDVLNGQIVGTAKIEYNRH